jgi:type II secretory pathway pseudopilin PulG
MSLSVHRRAFTLIELMLAVAIAIVVVLGVAVPSMRGFSRERRLRETFEKFDALARRAQLRAVKEQRSWTLIWQPAMISLQPDEPTPEERQTGGEGLREDFPFLEDETYVLQRPTSLLPPKDTPGEWTFWRSGTCEPVLITYSGPDGTWTARYDPLTGHGEIIEQAVQ